MVLRTARRGSNAGGQFWGCTGYSSAACRGTRSYREESASRTEGIAARAPAGADEIRQLAEPVTDLERCVPSRTLGQKIWLSLSGVFFLTVLVGPWVGTLLFPSSRDALVPSLLVGFPVLVFACLNLGNAADRKGDKAYRDSLPKPKPELRRGYRGGYYWANGKSRYEWAQHDWLRKHKSIPWWFPLVFIGDYVLGFFFLAVIFFVLLGISLLVRFLTGD